MNLSYREKSTWVSMLASLIVATYFYGDIVTLLLMGEDAKQQAIGVVLLKTVIAITIIEVIFHSLLAMKNQEGSNLPEDEREILFRLKANQAGYWTLSIGVIVCIVQEVITNRFISKGIGLPDGRIDIAIMQGALELKLVIIFWVSEIVRFASLLVFYRRGD